MFPDLRISTPELEPDQVLLDQLAELSAASVPSRRDGPVRALVAAVTVVVLVCFSWLTGALPGVASPFDGVRDQRPAPQHAPRTTSASDAAAEPGGAPPSQPAAVPPGQGLTEHDQGNHTGLTKPDHHDSGLHTGLTGAQHDQGHHNGQTKPHESNGLHNGQTKPHDDNGHHNGQTKPHVDNGHHQGQTRPNHDHGNGIGPRT